MYKQNCLDSQCMMVENSYRGHTNFMEVVLNQDYPDFLWSQLSPGQYNAK